MSRNERGIKYEKDIDLIELVLDWISHWRSLILFMLGGIVVVGIYVMSSIEQNNKQGVFISDYSDMHDTMSAKDKMDVNNAILLTDELIDDINDLKKTRYNLSLLERIEAVHYLLDDVNTLKGILNGFSEDQKEIYNSNYSEETKSEETRGFSSKIDRRIALIIPCIVFLHLCICALKYLLSDTVRHSDDFSNITSSPELSRVVDWDNINKKIGLDKFVYKILFYGIKKITMNEAIEINSIYINRIMKNQNYNSVSIIGYNLEMERDMLKAGLLEVDCNLIIKSVDCVFQNRTALQDVLNTESAVMVMRTGHSRYRDFLGDYGVIRESGLDILGVVVFE